MSAVEIDGEVWTKFAVDYESDGKPYSVYIRARTLGEAQAMLADLKMTGNIGRYIFAKVKDGETKDD